MRRIIFCLILIIDLGIINGQTDSFSVDCGPDTFFCFGLYSDTTFHIGTKVTIKNGIPPYKYSWTINKYFYIMQYLYAKDFLSDTTKKNPSLLHYIKGAWFYLQVTDTTGHVATDSVYVRSSRFVINLLSINYKIEEGDSLLIGFKGCGGGIPPLKYYWTPSEFVLDSAEVQTWFKPNKTTNFYQYAIDSVGCRSHDMELITVFVNPVSINSIGKNKISLRQNGMDMVFENTLQKVADFSLYTLEGKLIFSQKTRSSKITIPEILLINQIYLGVLKIGGEEYTVKVVH
jgi:hypothetical protein